MEEINLDLEKDIHNSVDVSLSNSNPNPNNLIPISPILLSFRIFQIKIFINLPLNYFLT